MSSSFQFRLHLELVRDHRRKVQQMMGKGKAPEYGALHTLARRQVDDRIREAFGVRRIPALSPT